MLPPAIGAERDASAGRGGAVRGCPVTHPGGLGVLNARDVPCPKPAACPALRRCAGPAPSHRLRPARSATRRPGGTGRCWAVVLGHRVWWRPSAQGAHELCRLRMRLELRRHPRHGGTSLLGPTSEQHDPPPSMEPVRHRNGPAASPNAARTARRAPEPGAAARERVLLVCLRWGINSVLKLGLSGRRKQRLGGVLGTVGSRNGPRGHPRTTRRAPRARRRA